METDIELQIEFIKANLKEPLVMLGLMGAGKTKIGQMVAERLGFEFVDSDEVIVEREKKSISEIFGPNNVNEAEFRKIEQEVITDLMTSNHNRVISTGGGAFMNKMTRAAIALNGRSIFLKASLNTLCERVGNGEGRPLLENASSPREKLSELIDLRYPVYSEADITVETGDQTKEEMVDKVINAVYMHLKHP